MSRVNITTAEVFADDDDNHPVAQITRVGGGFYKVDALIGTKHRVGDGYATFGEATAAAGDYATQVAASEVSRIEVGHAAEVAQLKARIAELEG